MLRTTVRPLHSLFTHFLIERDQLTAHFARFGSGFILDNQIKLAREHLATIQDLMKEIEERKDEKKTPIPVWYNDCCPKK